MCMDPLMPKIFLGYPMRSFPPNEDFEKDDGTGAREAIVLCTSGLIRTMRNCSSIAFTHRQNRM